MITGHRLVSVRILLFFTRSCEAAKKAKDSPQSHRGKQKVGKELLNTSRSGRDRRRNGTNSFWFYRHSTEILVFLCALSRSTIAPRSRPVDFWNCRTPLGWILLSRANCPLPAWLLRLAFSTRSGIIVSELISNRQFSQPCDTCDGIRDERT